MFSFLFIEKCMQVISKNMKKAADEASSKKMGGYSEQKDFGGPSPK